MPLLPVELTHNVSVVMSAPRHLPGRTRRGAAMTRDVAPSDRRPASSLSGGAT
jgi:hypothetical protein